MTVISQRPALGTLDRCSSVALLHVFFVFFGFKLFISVILCILKKMCIVKKKSCVCLQCPPNLHKQDGYLCQVNQVGMMFESFLLVLIGAVIQQNSSSGAAHRVFFYFSSLSEGPLLQWRVQDQREPV